MAFAIGSLHWPRIEYWCSDIHCPCGNHIHHCCYDGNGSAQFFECSQCKQVYILGNEVRLLLGRDRGGVTGHKDSLAATSEEITAYVQWKGTEVHMTVGCLCGQQFDVDRDFAYEEKCPHCRREYAVDWDIPVRKATEEEIAQATVIHRYEPEED